MFEMTPEGRKRVDRNDAVRQTDRISQLSQCSFLITTNSYPAFHQNSSNQHELVHTATQGCDSYTIKTNRSLWNVRVHIDSADTTDSSKYHSVSRHLPISIKTRKIEYSGHVMRHICLQKIRNNSSEFITNKAQRKTKTNAH